MEQIVKTTEPAKVSFEARDMFSFVARCVRVEWEWEWEGVDVEVNMNPQCGDVFG